MKLTISEVFTYLLLNVISHMYDGIKFFELIDFSNRYQVFKEKKVLIKE